VVTQLDGIDVIDGIDIELTALGGAKRFTLTDHSAGVKGGPPK
jgi:hypothetical protein